MSPPASACPATPYSSVLSQNIFLRALTLVLLLVGAVLSVPLQAQTFTATITGTVTDPSGAAVHNVVVEVKNSGTNEVRHITTDGNGRFAAPQLMPGIYSLTVTADGFKSFTESGIELQGNQVSDHTANLELGSSQQTVEVTASTVAIDSETANREVTIGAEQVQDLPTSFRNPLFLVQSTAGVVAVRTGLSAYTTDQNQNRFSLNGGRDESAAILVDGASIVAPDLGGAIASPTQDAVSEVQVQRTAYDTQFTHTDGGVVSMITKRGSNTLHGGVFEFIRNNHLDANSWDNNRVGIARPLFQRNQFGGNLGGAIFKDKLFLFGAYEGLRQGQPQTYVDTVPTALERTGDFSQSLNPDGTLDVIYNPFTTVASSTSASGYTRTAFPGNKIPASMLSAVGLQAAALYPLPNATSTSLSNSSNYAASTKVVSNYDKFDIRGDYIINAKDSLFGRVTKAWQLNGIPTFFHNAGDNQQGENDYRYETIFGNTWVPNDRWVINTLVSYGRWTEVDTTPSYGHPGTEIGLPSATVSEFQAPILPQFNLENFAQLGYSAYSFSPHETEGLQLNVSHEFHGHSLKFGWSGEIQRLYPSTVSSANFTFNRGLTSGSDAATDSTATGNSIASLLLGTGSTGDAPNQTKLDLQQLNWGWYVQDSWRVTNRLTLSGGVRYDIQGARTERLNRLNNFSLDAVSPLATTTGLPLKGGLVFANASHRGLWDTDYTNFDPRFSIAYKANEQLVFRAGYGVFNPPTYVVSGDAQRSSDGFSSDTTWNSTQGNAGFIPENLLDNPFPQGLTQPTGSSAGLLTQVGQIVNAALSHHPTPYMQVYSADFQLQISPSGTFEMGYAGTQGRKLLYGVYTNLDQLPSQYLSLGSQLNATVANPFAGSITSGALSGATIPYWRTLVHYPQFSSVNLLAGTPGSSSSFNALTAKYNQRFSNGLNALLTYQWSKAIDDTSETNGWEVSDALRDTFNHRLDRSISAHDIPQAFVGTILWDLPFGRGRSFGSNLNRYVDSVIGGWKLTTIVRLSSGMPLQFTADNALANYNYMVTRPNVTSVGDLKLQKRTIGEWFNTAALSSAGTTSLGNVPRFVSNVRRSPTRDADMALEKNFPLYRETRLQIRAEAYNVSNTPQYAAPDTHLGDGNIGQITGTTNVGPRTLQLGARIDF
ncbi:TonB-dependent receptor [Granulicella arctica]|uniref:Outer membrane receptor protein involved in Fe transport n=1 Tax=Granulicella arctica TaxID=940613 RepID=A0A7Y9TFZ1_9BACT|nr:TonB-dependent receptor [Granulicella arctica]NYF78879.1 outer membrane receptor protein involved in Fe transport [Granulicella arctica]